MVLDYDVNLMPRTEQGSTRTFQGATLATVAALSLLAGFCGTLLLAHPGATSPATVAVPASASAPVQPNVAGRGAAGQAAGWDGHFHGRANQAPKTYEAARALPSSTFARGSAVRSRRTSHALATTQAPAPIVRAYPGAPASATAGSYPGVVKIVIPPTITPPRAPAGSVNTLSGTGGA